MIVESPAKARTIERYLGDDYRVLASYGHVRDLPENPGKGKFGVDVDHDFAPEYVISDDRRKQVTDIERAAKGSDLVYLATDLDREGEAIAWHVAEAAHVPSEKTRRVTFSEITEPAIRAAFANPRVYAGGSRGKIDSVPAEREINFRDLLTHTSGLTYGFMESNPVDALYRSKTNGVDFQTATTSLKDLVERLGTFPLTAKRHIRGRTSAL